MQHTHRTSEQGVTLVEVLLVTVVLAIIIPVFATILIGAYRESYTSNASTSLSSQNMRALMYIEQGVRNARTFLISVPGQYSDAYGSQNLGSSGANAWSYKGLSSSSRVLIVDGYATSSNALSNARLPVYRSDGSYNCNSLKTYQPKLSYTTLYFVRNSTLYKRILTDTTSPLCPGEAQAQKQSCPPEIALASRDASCQADDEVLATNVASFTITYYQDNSPSSVIDVYNSNDPSVLNPTDYISVSLTLTDREGSIVSALSQRIAKQND